MQYTIAGYKKGTQKMVDVYDTIKDKGEAETTRDLLNEDNEDNLDWRMKSDATNQAEITEILSH